MRSNFFKVVLMFIVVFSLSGITTGSVGAEDIVTKEPFTISNILAHDSIKAGMGGNEPAKVESVKNLLTNKPANRTGWSAAIFWCDYGTHYDEMGHASNEKTGIYWAESIRDNTSDSGKDKIYSVSDYREEIMDRYGEEIYAEALKSGQNLQYQEGTSRVIYGKDIRNSVPCNKDSGKTEAYFYNNLDFELTMTFDIEKSTPVKPPTVPKPEGSACSSHGWEDFSVSELSKVQEMIKCPSVGVDPKAEGFVDWKLYKPNPTGISAVEVKNKIEKHRDNTEIVDGKERHVIKDGTMMWHTRAPGIPASKVKHVSTSPPSAISPIMADILKNSSVNYDFEYQYTNHWEERWYRTCTREKIYATSCSTSTDKDGNKTTSCHTYFTGNYTSWSCEAGNKEYDKPDWTKIKKYEKNMDLDVKHKRGESKDMGESETSRELEIGRYKKAEEPDSASPIIAKETLSMSARDFESKKTQTSMEFVKNPLSYSTENTELFMGAVSFYNIQPLIEYYPVDMDVNLRSKYTGYGGRSSNQYTVKLNMDKSNPGSMKLTSIDSFYTTNDTGLLFSVTGGSGSADAEAQMAYTGFTGSNYRDSVYNADAVYKTSYYIPIDANNTTLVPGQEYINDFTIGKLGLNDYTLDFKQGFSFGRYLLGSVEDNAWVVEQPDPLTSVNYVHSVNIDPESGYELKKKFNERTKLLHDFRVADGKDFYDKVKSILGM